MWFSLFSTVLILAITFYQGLQGLFSGLINCILAMISAVLAFGFYENVYFNFLADRQPEFGRAVALLAIFILSLLILRVVFDALIKGNVHFPVYVDRAGGGIFGFISAMIVVGMLNIGFQMLPFPPDFMGFSRFKMVNTDTNETIPWPSRDPKAANATPPSNLDFGKIRLVRQSTWLNAGGFTAGLASHLSSNALRGNEEAAFSEIHPDFLAEMFHAKANLLGASRLTAKAGSLDIIGYWDMPPGGLFAREFKEDGDKKRIRLIKGEAPDSGFKDVVIRVRVQDAKDEGGDAVRFTPDQVRLFCRDEQNAPLKPYALAGINEDAPQAQNRLVQVHPGEPIARSDNTEMDFVFRIPDKPGLALAYLEFKQDARVEVPFSKFNKKPMFAIGFKPPKGGAKPKPEPSADNSGSDAGTGSNAPNTLRAVKPGELPADYGRTAVLGPAQGVAVSAGLPFDKDKPVTEYGGQNEISSGTIKGARNLMIPLDKEWQPVPGNMPPIEKFEVPADKRLVQISVERLQPGSYLGRAKSYAVENIEDFYLEDAKGSQYLPVGMYAIADVHGKKTFELVFLNAEGEQGFAKLPKLNHIHRDDLKDQYALVYLFIVPPGTVLKDVHTGGHPVDLTTFPPVK